MGALSPDEVVAKEESRLDFRKWALMEEMSWRHKSREVLLKEGDRNINFFHKMPNANRRRNSFGKVKINGVCLTKEIEIKEGIVRAFHNHFLELGEWRFSIRDTNFGMLNWQDATKLKEPFLENEVFNACSNLNGDKTLAPNGFSMAFW